MTEAEIALEERIEAVAERVEELHDFLFNQFDDRIRNIERHPHLKNEGE